MSTYTISANDLSKEINPNTIFETYLEKVKRLAGKSRYECENNTIIEYRHDKKPRVLISYNTDSKSWTFRGTRLKAIETAITIGLTSPYLVLLKDNLKREENNRGMLGVSPCLKERSHFKDNSGFSMVFSENVSNVVGYLLETDAPTIEDIMGVMKKNQKVLADKVGVEGNIYFQKRPKDRRYVTEVYRNDMRFSGAYSYLEKEMSERFSAMVPMDEQDPNFMRQQMLVSFGLQFKDKNTSFSSQMYNRVIGLLKILQLGDEDFSFDSLFSRQGTGKKPNIYLDEILYKDYPFKESEHIFTEDVFRAKDWRLTSTYINTEDIKLEMHDMQNSSYFARLTGGFSFGRVGQLIEVTESVQNSESDKDLLDANPHSYIVRCNKQFPKKTNADKISTKAGVARARYIGHSYEVSFIACCIQQKVRRDGIRPYNIEVTDRGIEIIHPNPDFDVINGLLENTLALIKDSDHSAVNKNTAIRSIAKLMYTMILQTPFLNGTRTISEIIGQSLLYLVAQKYKEKGLMRYWNAYKNTTWDFLVHGHNFRSQVESVTLNGFTKDFVNHIIVGEPWSFEQVQFVLSKLDRPSTPLFKIT